MGGINLGVDARLYGIAHRGIGRYTQGLIDALRLTPAISLTVFTSTPDAFSPRPGERVRMAPYRAYSFGEQVAFARQVNRSGVTLMHFPHFNVPYFIRIPYVVTIHDLILHHHPSRTASTRIAPWYWMKYAAYRWMFRRTLRRARAVIAVSRYTAEDLLTYYPWLSKRLHVVGETAHFLEKSTNRTDSTAALTYTTDEGPYALYVGAFYPHKNVTRLIDAWHMVYQTTGVRLLLAGKIDVFAERIQQTRGRNGTTAGGVRFLGEVSETGLPDLYKRAHIVVIPSLDEGLGLIGSEAAQYGAPVVASGYGALPETYGRYAVYVPVDDTESLARALIDTVRNVWVGRQSIPPPLTHDELVSKLANIYQSAIDAP